MPGQTKGWKDGQKDRPYFIGPFRLPPGVQLMSCASIYVSFTYGIC